MKWSSNLNFYQCINTDDKIKKGHATNSVTILFCFFSEIFLFSIICRRFDFRNKFLKSHSKKRNISSKSCYAFDINVLASIIHQNSIKVLVLSEFRCCSTFISITFFATKRTFFPSHNDICSKQRLSKFRYNFFYVNIEISITCQTVWIFIFTF